MKITLHTQLALPHIKATFEEFELAKANKVCAEVLAHNDHEITAMVMELVEAIRRHGSENNRAMIVDTHENLCFAIGA